jgi:hypothetical protein
VGDRSGEGGAAVGTEAAAALEKVGEELGAVLADTEREIGTLAGAFEELARATGPVLENAATVAGCAEGERVLSLPPRVQQLDSATRSFLRERLTATAGIVQTVTEEAALLGQLARQTQAQRAIAKETEMLRVLTNIEVARLGEVGAGFAYLAQELSDFSQAVAKSTGDLMGHTEERKKSVEETRRTLARELPRMREEFGRMEEGLESAVTRVGSIVQHLSRTPGQFRQCVEEIAAEIAGVVAAIQGHDITRQQIEHVRDAVQAMAEELREARTGVRLDEAEKSAELAIGLKVQSYQLRSIRETVEGWTAQIRRCLEGIGRIASSEILELAPAVLAEEREISSQMGGIERVEEACLAADAKVRGSFAGIAGLMQLVREHLERSKAVRDRLQLLMFNSIVEASHLGTQADGILEISTTIKRIAGAWSGITIQSEKAMGEIAGLVNANGTALAVFEQGRRSEMGEARSAMHEGLEILRSAAACAETKGREIQEQIGLVREKLVRIGGSRDRLDDCFGRLAAALETLEQVRNGMPAAEEGRCDAEAVERRFSAGYTTEMEREVLRAALRGGPLPTAASSFAGNGVELF